MTEIGSAPASALRSEADYVPHAAAGRAARSFAGLVASLGLSILGLTMVTFVIGRFIPIDPVLAIVGDHATRDVYDRTRIALGLDRSVPEQYLIYLKKVLHGDLGISVITSHPVLPISSTSSRRPSSWRPSRP